MKIAIDADIPIKAYRALQVVYGSDETEFVYIPELVPANTQDEFWADEFRRVGGRITISADRNIAKRPHQILAFQQNELICFFLSSRWSETRLNVKAAHLIYWWPMIEKKIEESSVGDVWQIPAGFTGGDMKNLRIPDDAIARLAREGSPSGPKSSSA